MTHWDMAGRDVVPDFGMNAAPIDVGGSILLAMLQCDGRPLDPNWTEVRAAARVRKKQVAPELQQASNQRFRTYKTLFRGLGLLYDSGDLLNSTTLGKRLFEILEIQRQTVDDYGAQVALTYRRKIAELIAPSLVKYQLRNPWTARDYPPEVTVHPLWVIWKAIRELDGKLHWEEIARVISGCLTDDDVVPAIKKIRAARSQDNYDPTNDALLESVLGPRLAQTPAADYSDRVDVWFSRAAFKNLFLEQRDQTDGYRHLNPEFRTLMDIQLKAPPEYNPTKDGDEYVQWIGDAPVASSISLDAPPASMTELVSLARQYGDRRIITLSGPAGTGKTRAAKAMAKILTGGDASRLEVLQFHASYSYEEFIGGWAPAGDGKFSRQEGAFLRFNKKALRDPDNTYVLLIDELSRADVGNVLGEVLTYVEYRDALFTIPALDAQFSIAKNLIIISTMNPQDRSVLNMDDALIRRLRQVTIGPSSEALAEILDQAGMEVSLRESVVRWFQALPSDIPFGHGLFVGVANREDLEQLWAQSLQHFLYRGGLASYHDADKIESTFPWKTSTDVHIVDIESPALNDVDGPTASGDFRSQDDE